MGVLRLFRWIVQHYPESFWKVNAPLYRENSDVFLIDCNAIFHPCCREIYFPENPRLLKAPPTAEELKNRAFLRIYARLVELIDIARPTKAVYLAIDGVAGCCKQSQQRKRRFKSAQEAKASGDFEVFDTANLTAGTQYMLDLCDYLKTKFKQEKEAGNKVFGKLSILINDVRNAGEG